MQGYTLELTPKSRGWLHNPLIGLRPRQDCNRPRYSDFITASAFIARWPSTLCAQRLALPLGSGLPHTQSGAVSHSRLTARNREDFKASVEFRPHRAADNVAIDR